MRARASLTTQGVDADAQLQEGKHAGEGVSSSPITDTDSPEASSTLNPKAVWPGMYPVEAQDMPPTAYHSCSAAEGRYA